MSSQLAKSVNPSPEPNYYVPAQSRLPIIMATAMFLTVFGLGNWINGEAKGPYIFLLGFGLMFIGLYSWFNSVIGENIQGMNSPRLKHSYVLGMSWFIFSEVMFFSAFFGALFYVRTFALPHLSEGPTSDLLWNDFQMQWPLMNTPDSLVNGESAVHQGPESNMGFPGWSAVFGWLPLWNTIVLLSSSFTVHFAHTSLKNDNKKLFNIWLAVTVVLGVIFLILQATEYYEAYHHLGLTLSSGIYGATFFILTGFHGLHVTMGTLMLFIMLMRSVTKNHFKHDNCFGFEAASWYWHFVDVVWLGLFLFVYVLA